MELTPLSRRQMLGALISGGTQLDYGSATGGTIFTGSQVIEIGGVGSGT